MAKLKQMDVEEYLAEVMAAHPKGFRLTPEGAEVPDPTPLAPPVSLRAGPSIIEHVRNLVQSELMRRQAQAEGFETFEEADDFDVGEDFDPTSPYENEFEPPIPQASMEPASAGSGSAVGAEPGPPAAPPAEPKDPSPKAP